ncbi:nitrite reductase small subunit NirD [Amycolatopsis pithecellobii]|uniref:Nitrite reductase small subunit NirD n=1 Tax=Amycolatopsis pithecellobii TaxID=664692 RepID=A0A6N7Z407_9PSEU|nr:nitrite reductase small subunit NirD [Amycolatopsis pithecellobii]MTD55081.1 nitrite reductase small subunit NirD [Amycolatopsis pithecellobii]
MTTMETRTVAVCELSQLIPGRGVAALLPDGRQVAIFLTTDGECHALSNIDPFGKAAVLSRGLVGESGGQPFVASPLLKQRFDLRTGVCLDDESVVIRTYPVHIVDGVVHVSS